MKTGASVFVAVAVDHDDGTRHFIKQIREFGNRLLRVVANAMVFPEQRVTAFFDRRLRRMRQITRRWGGRPLTSPDKARHRSLLPPNSGVDAGRIKAEGEA